MATDLFVEEVEPLCTWRRKENCDTLDVDLNGFAEDRIKINPNNRRIISISGECPSDGTLKWKRLYKEIKVLKDYKVDGMKTVFANGHLHVMIPKKDPSGAAFYQHWLKVALGVVMPVALGATLGAYARRILC